MRILLIAYSFPPFQDGQSLRWYYLSNALAELGVKIDVVTIKHPLEDKTSWNLHKNIEVLGTYPGPIEFFALRAKRNIGVDGEGNRELRKSGKFRLMKSSYWGIRNFVGNLLPGDVRTEWFPFAIRFIRERMDIRKYDFLVTSHEPWVDSLLGLYFKKRDPKIRWIADFGDPYVALYTPKHKLWFENYFEQWIYKNASVLIFTNGKVIDHLLNKYHSLKDKTFWVIEQGFSYRLSGGRESERHKNKIFTLIYTGTFYRDFRDPSNLIKALSMLDFEYKFFLAGRNEKFINDFKILGDHFEFLGLVGHFEILRLQRGSDVLVHLANKNSSIQIPGKFYEYLGALKPILTIHYDRSDPTKKLVEELKCGMSCKDDPVEIKNSLELLYSRWKDNENRCRINVEDIYQYSWEKKAQMIYENLTKSDLSN
jgi:glycosyltransferase involved in cell wall biosynthesis